MGAAIAPLILQLLLNVRVFRVHVEGRDHVLYDAAIGGRQGARYDRLTLEGVAIDSLVWTSRSLSALRGIHRIHSREHATVSLAWSHAVMMCIFMLEVCSHRLLSLRKQLLHIVSTGSLLFHDQDLILSCQSVVEVRIVGLIINILFLACP